MKHAGGDRGWDRNRQDPMCLWRCEFHQIAGPSRIGAIQHDLTVLHLVMEVLLLFSGYRYSTTRAWLLMVPMDGRVLNVNWWMAWTVRCGAVSHYDVSTMAGMNKNGVLYLNIMMMALRCNENIFRSHPQVHRSTSAIIIRIRIRDKYISPHPRTPFPTSQPPSSQSSPLAPNPKSWPVVNLVSIFSRPAPVLHPIDGTTALKSSSPPFPIPSFALHCSPTSC